MTEFDYDCYRKKNIAHSAARRKCGSKSKKCSLSTDHMTNKQWNERCGDVVSYQIGKPMFWVEFCRLPKDLKEEYLNSLVDKYNANIRCLAEMFGVSPATISRAVKKEGLNVKFLRGKYPSGEKEAAFKQFLCGSLSQEEETTTLKEPEDTANNNEFDKEKDENIVDETLKETHKTKLDSFTINFSGKTDVDMIANSLRYILGNDTRARIQIICQMD